MSDPLYPPDDFGEAFDDAAARLREAVADACARPEPWPARVCAVQVVINLLAHYFDCGFSARLEREMIHVTDVEPLAGHWIRVTFSDGALMEIDVSDLLSRGGVFAPIRDKREIFEQVRVNSETRTVEWPGDRGAVPRTPLPIRFALDGRPHGGTRPCRYLQQRSCHRPTRR